METTRHNFRLAFNTNLNGILTMNVPHADPDLTDAHIRDAMDSIIASNVVRSAAGDPQFRHSAELISTERTEFTLF